MSKNETNPIGSNDPMGGSEEATGDAAENAASPAAAGAEASPLDDAATTAPDAGEGELDDEQLTVDDILDAEQTTEAAGADDASGDEAEPAHDERGEGDGGSAPQNPLEDQANPYLEDLRRLTAEYANYRKRTEANQERDRQRATALAVTPLLTVLDDLDRAEQHGDLAEGSAFATIAQKLRAAVEKLGLESFGAQGDAFDPQVHEAVAQVPVPGAEGETVLDVIERGYRIGEVELRPAKVAVQVAADG